MVNKCRFCKSDDFDPFADFGNMPISRFYREDLDEHLPKVRMDIVICKKCKLIQNKFIPNLDALYQSKHYSTAFQRPKHLNELISTALCYAEPTNVIDIGSNDGSLIEFLRQFDEIEKIIGIEPNKMNVEISRRHGHTVYEGYLNQKLANEIILKEGKFEIIICRHVLEHVPDFITFLKDCKSLMKDDGVFILELPNVDEGFGFGNPVIIWEEHVNYFTKSIIRNILDAAGYKILAERDYLFGGGAIAFFLKKIEKSATKKISLSYTTNEYSNFNAVSLEISSISKSVISEAKKNGFKILVFGCGPRTSTFINFCGIGEDIDFYIDDRPDLNGLFLPGGNTPIICFEQLKLNSSDKILVFLGVGSENNTKIKLKFAKHPGIKKYISMFHPNDTLGELKLMNFDFKI